MLVDRFVGLFHDARMANPNPNQATRFQKGNSGNPNGRPKRNDAGRFVPNPTSAEDRRAAWLKEQLAAPPSKQMMELYEMSKDWYPENYPGGKAAYFKNVRKDDCGPHCTKDCPCRCHVPSVWENGKLVTHAP